MSTSELLWLLWSWTDCVASDSTFHSWKRGPREYLIRFPTVMYQPSCWRTAFCACAGIKSKMTVSNFFRTSACKYGTKQYSRIVESIVSSGTTSEKNLLMKFSWAVLRNSVWGFASFSGSNISKSPYCSSDKLPAWGIPLSLLDSREREVRAVTSAILGIPVVCCSGPDE